MIEDKEDEGFTSTRIIQELSKWESYNDVANCIPRTDETYRLSGTIHIDGRVMTYLKDDFLGLGSNVFPIVVPEDGNCLIHAVVYAMWGERKSYDKLFRQLILEELTVNEAFYRSAIDTLTSECQGYTNEEFNKFIGDVQSANAFLSFLHIFALSNILKRPICICASKDDIKKWGDHEEGCAGLFLPTRIGAAHCCAEPIFISWSSVEHYHFVPLCKQDDDDDMDYFSLPQVVYKRTLKSNEPLEIYLNYAKLNTQKKLYLLKTPTEKTPEFDNILKLQFATNEETRQLMYPLKYRDDPKDVAREIITLSGIPEESFQSLYDHVCSLKRKAIESGVYEEPKIIVKIPKLKCQYIPFNEPYHLRGIDANLLKEMERRILENNLQLAQIVRTRNYKPYVKAFECFHVMDDREIEKFQLLIGILTSVNHQDTLQYETVVFPEDALQVIGNLITWPNDLVFPVIDLARVLILYKSAAQFFVNEQNNYFSIVFGIMKFPNVPFNCCIVILRLFLNLFSQKCLTEILVQDSNEIIEILDKCTTALNYNEKQNVLVLDHVSKVYVNFAKLWQEGPKNRAKDHTKSLIAILESCLLILNYDTPLTNDTIILNTLIALGTVLQKNGRLHFPAEQIHRVVLRYLKYQNPIISECMKYIVAVMDTEPVEIQQ